MSKSKENTNRKKSNARKIYENGEWRRKNIPIYEGNNAREIYANRVKANAIEEYNAFVEESNSLLNKTNSRYYDAAGNYIDEYRSDYSDWYDYTTKSISTLKDRSKKLNEIVDKYGSYYDDDFNSRLKSLEQEIGKFDNLATAAKTEYDLFSKGEDAYFAYQQQKKYKNYSYQELKTAIAELDADARDGIFDSSDREKLQKEADWLRSYINTVSDGVVYDFDLMTKHYDDAMWLQGKKIDYQNQLYGNALKEGKSDYEAKKIAQTGDKLPWYESQFKKFGYYTGNVEEDYRKAKSTQNRKIEQDTMAKSDFAEKSVYAPSAPKTDEEMYAAGYKKASTGEWYMPSGRFGSEAKAYTGEDSDFYTYINNPEKRREIEHNHTVQGYNEYLENGYDQLTEDEVGVYNYLYATDKAKADDYLSKLKPTLQKRILNREALKYAELAEKFPIIMSAYSVGTNVANTMMLPGKMIAALAGNYEENLWLDKFNVQTQAIRGSVTEDSNYVDKLLYNAAMSIADMSVAAGIGGSAGSVATGFGTDAALATKIAGLTTQGVMSAGAASSSISDSIADRKSGLEAVIRGVGAGAIEWATEKYSVEKLLSNPSSIKNYLWQNTYVEGLEEGASNLANLALDGVISKITGDRNQIQKEVDELVLGGKTKNEAFKQVLNGRIANLAEDVITGAISGFGMSGGALATGAVAAKSAEAEQLKKAGIDITDNKRINELISVTNATNNAKLIKLAEQIKGVDYESLSDTKKIDYTNKVGKLYSKLLDVQGKRYYSAPKDTVKNIVAEKLKTKGVEESKIDKAADTIVKQLLEKNKALTPTEKKIFDEVGGTALFNEIKDSKDVQIEVGKAQKDALGQYFETASLTEEKTKSPIDVSAFEITDDGKTYIRNSGEEVAITGISSVNKGKMMVNLSNGKTENIKNLDLGVNDAIIYQGILDMGVDPSIGQFVAKSFDESGLDASTYIFGVRDAIHYGKIGGKAFLNEGTFTTELSEKLREDLYKLGEKYTRESIVEEEQNIEKSIASGNNKTKTGSISFKGVGRSELNARQKASVNAIEAAFGVMGINVVFFESPVNEKGKHIGKNGSYNPETNTIELDISAGINGQGTILFTASHELTHFIKEWSPTKFKIFADFLVQQYHAHGVNVDELVQAKMEKFKLDYDTAFEEVVADSCESFLRDSNLMKTLTNLAKADMDLFERVGLFLKNLLEDLKKAYQGLTPDSEESRIVLNMKDCIKELHDMWDEAALVARYNYQQAGGKKTSSSSIKNTNNENGAKYSWRNDKNGNKYWQIDTNKDIFKGLTTTQEYENAAFKYILGLRDGNVVVDAIDGKKMSFIRLSADEFTNSDESQILKRNDAIMFAQKMRLIPSLEDLASNASVNWWSPDFKNHKLFKARGFENFRGRVGIDNVIFNFVIRAGKAKFGDIFYDINLEVDSILPHTDGASEIQKSTSKDRISQKSNPVNTNSMQESDKNSEKKSERNYSYKELGYDAFYTDSEVYSYDFLTHQKNIKIVELPKIDELKQTKNKIDKGKVVSLGLLNAENVGKKVEDKIYVKNRYTERELLITSSAIRHGLNGDTNRLFTNSRLGAVIGDIVKNAIPINALKTNEQNVNGTYAMAAYTKGTEGREIVAIVTVENRKGNVLGIETYDVIHSLSGRIKKVSNNLVGTKPQGFNPSTKVTDNISVADFLEIVNGVYRSILSKDVLNTLGEENKESGYYTNRVLFSERDPDTIEIYEKVVETLKSENAKLTEDVERLKELVKLQRTETHNKVLTKFSVDAVAKKLMKNTSAKGNRAELVKHLEDVYSYILQGEDVSWEGVMEKAENAVNWLMSHEYVKTERDEYANTILKDLRTARFYLDDYQKQEVAYKYGSYNEFRKKAMGRFIVTDKANISLDSFWSELAENYSGTFDASISSGDQPIVLMDIVDSLQEKVPVDYYGSTEMDRQELLMSVYEGYWDVSTLTTYADRKQKEINLLKSKHREQMSKLRETHNEKTLQLKKEYNQKLADVRAKSIEKQEAIVKHYQEARKKDIENRSKTELRRKIKGVVNELDKLLMRGNKEKHVKEDMQDVALAMLKSADAVFSTSYSNKKIVRGDISQMILTEKEKTLVESYKDILDKIDRTKSKIRELNESGTSDAELLNKLYKNLSNDENLSKHYDSMLEDVFKRERIRISNVTVPQALKELADAYKSIQKSEYAYISNIYNPVVAERLDDLSTDKGMNRLFTEMSPDQLNEIYDAYKMVLTTIRDANKTFAFDKLITVEKLGTTVRSELEKIRTSTQSGPIRDFLRKQGWDMLKPIYAFRIIGSDTLTKLYENIRNGEDLWYRDTKEAKDYRSEMKQKYGYNSWDLKATYHFVSNNGREFSLTLEQIMSLYALSRRNQSLEHLMQGGIVLEDAVEVNDSKTGKTYEVKTANTFTFSPELLNKVTKVVRDNANMRGYVESMQEYLTKMGDKGNEVSMKLFGVRLFKEKIYFPIKSSETYMNFKPEEAGEFKIKNSSFTNSTKKFANNPIVLSNFDEVWGGHVNDMSLYHAFTLPLEDFARVFNYRTHVDTELGQDAVRGALKNAYGDGAEKYIRNLLKDLNGGVRSQQGAEIPNLLISKVKKASVFASASVTVQQPSAIARAFAHINPKYFVNIKQFDYKHHNETWEELKKYAPVAGIKEMGYFDTGMGQTSVDWIIEDNPESFREGIKAFFSKDSSYRDEVLSKFPALADELTWVSIWQAVKREVADNYDNNAKDYLDKCGKRFTEVITLTQVYDSVLSRSGLMRSKDTLTKTAVAFMAEPTTTMNMVYDSFVQKHRKTGKAHPGRAISAAVTSVVLNALLKALVTAGRDDDEDEAWIEKYIAASTGSFIGDINPLAYIPFVKDAYSIFLGYDIKRMDMTIVEQLADSVLNISKDSVPMHKKIIDVIGTASSIFGIPARNIIRDICGVINIATSLGVAPTSYGIGEAFKEGFTGQETTSTDRAWNAFKRGNTSDVRKIVSNLIDDKVESNKTKKEAKSAVRSSFTLKYKEKYLKAVENKDRTQMNEIRKFLRATGLYGSLNEVDETLKKWRKNK